MHGAAVRGIDRLNTTQPAHQPRVNTSFRPMSMKHFDSGGANMTGKQSHVIKIAGMWVLPHSKGKSRSRVFADLINFIDKIRVDSAAVRVAAEKVSGRQAKNKLVHMLANAAPGITEDLHHADWQRSLR